jgi:glucose/arabinose dehydrogenase
MTFRTPVLRLFAAVALMGVMSGAGANGHSLRFFGTGSGDIDRVKIALATGSVSRAVNIGRDFTIEFWLKATAGQNTGAVVAGNTDAWVNGNIIIDRNVVGAGDYGDFGVSLGGERVAFGVAVGATAQTIVGATNVANGLWRHIAVTRRADTGAMAVFVDGVLDASAAAGPTGDISYRAGRATSYPNTDPFLVVGAEKRDVGSSFPSYRGWLDEMRVSSLVRYTAAFTRPAAPFIRDGQTMALYHFDEAGGDTLVDAATAVGSPSPGDIRRGGASNGPAWSTDTPFAALVGDLEIRPWLAGFSSPVDIAVAPDGSGRVYVVQQGGTIRIVENGATLPTPFLALGAPPVLAGGERGLLSLAFHPNYAQNGYFYIYYTASSPAGAVTVARYSRSAADPRVANPASGVILLSIAHGTHSNHNGGKLLFGPDGYLYISTGDGGGADDPLGSGQTLNPAAANALLGKLLRINVDGGLPYTIPPDNPFVGNASVRPEIFAYGLRNPFRMAFDRGTGDLFIGDVGQGAREEIDLLPLSSPGGENFGWRIWEGTRCNTTASGVTQASCDALPQVAPILEYEHTVADAGSGFCSASVTGGFRYRGTRMPALNARYLFTDYCTGRLWYASLGNAGTWQRTIFSDTGLHFAAIVEDPEGEPILLGGDGTLYRLAPRDADSDGLPDWYERAIGGSTTTVVAAADAEGDGMSNLIEYRLNSNPLSRRGKPARVDFNRDGLADIVWREPASGGVVTWYVGNAGYTGAKFLGGDTTWTPLAMGRMRGLDETDIVWRAGANAIAWYMNRGNYLSSQFLCGLLPAAAFALSGPTDAAATGTDSVYVADPTGTGVRRFAGNAPCASLISEANGLSGAVAVASGDFDGDSRTDYILRQASGATYLWRAAAPSTYTLLGGDADWSIFGAGDFNGDGRTDLVWRQASSGAYVVWFMDGTSIVSQSVLGIVNGWSIAKTADIDGDGKDDIVWQQPNGTAVVWFMDGATRTGGVTLSGPTTWRVLPY